MLLGLSQLAMAEDPVNFPDANLKAAVENELGISAPTPTDMLSLTSLTAYSSGIVDLTGIEYATNLTHLHLDYNQISNVSALSGWRAGAANQLSRPIASADASVSAGTTDRRRG